jgi:hypothetical protein
MARTATYDGVEYEVWFDGINDGKDSDVLVKARRIELKHWPAPVEPPRRAPVHTAVYAALPERNQCALSLRELVAKTGLTRHQINSALCTLRLQKRLASERLSAEDRRTRPAQRYWRV